MPASDQSALAILQNFSNPYIQQRYKADGITEANLFKLCRAISTAFHAETGQAVDDLGPQRFDLTAVQGFLDRRAIFWNVPRQEGETDAQVRLKIGQVKLKRWGAFNVDEMVSLLATLLQADPSTIQVFENQDETGNYEPALIQFRLTPTTFTNAGITDVAMAITVLEADLEFVAPAGVRVFIATQGTAIWDDPETIWDESGTWSEETATVGTVPPPILLPDSGGIGDTPIGEEPTGEG